MIESQAHRVIRSTVKFTSLAIYVMGFLGCLFSTCIFLEFITLTKSSSHLVGLIVPGSMILVVAGLCGALFSRAEKILVVTVPISLIFAFWAHFVSEAQKAFSEGLSLSWFEDWLIGEGGDLQHLEICSLVLLICLFLLALQCFAALLLVCVRRPIKF